MNTNLYVIERPARRIRFYADLDIMLDAHKEEEHEAFLTDACARIMRIATQVFPHENGNTAKVVILRAPRVVKSRVVADQITPQRVVKYGIHLVFPFTCLSPEKALTVRRDIVEQLIDGKNEPTNGWNDAFDEGVYLNGGLRLVFSSKLESCSCRQERQQERVVCPHRNGKVHTGRQYTLHDVLNADGTHDANWTLRLKKNHTLCVMMSSIRLTPPPSADDQAADVVHAAKRTKKTSSTLPPLHALVRNAHYLLHPIHRQLRIISTSRDTHLITLHFEHSANARFCPNVKREHNNSTLYATASKQRMAIELRCRCKKYDCHRFAMTLPLTASAYALLFGDTSASSSSGVPFFS